MTTTVIGEVPETREFLLYDHLKQLLEDAVKTAETKQEIELDESFFENVGYHVIEKERDTIKGSPIVSEQDTCYENFTKSDKNYEFEFRSSYEEAHSFSLMTQKGYSIGIGGNLGVGFMGASAGLNPSLQYNSSKANNQGQSQVEKKDLCVRGHLEPGQSIVVREFVRELKTSATCKLEIIIDEKAKVPFTYEKGGDTKEESIEMKKLLKAGKLATPSMRQDQKKVIFCVSGECTFKRLQHSLEVHPIPIKEERMSEVHKYDRPVVGGILYTHSKLM